jgi:DNA repair protein RadC
MAITDWPATNARASACSPDGAAALSDAELLAIFLRVGIRGKSAVDLARTLIWVISAAFPAVAASAPAFSAIPGMGLAKYAQLQAVLELARRALREEMARRDVLDSPRAVRDWLRLKLASLPHEVFMILLLDAQNRVITTVELFRGTLTQTSVLSARSGQAGPRTQRRRGDPGPQPPSGVGRTQPPTRR